MKILHFYAEKLHGYLTFSLHFQPDLVFLTGINGAGKTSAVRSITALLTPSFILLADMQYVSLRVIVEIDGVEMTISSRRSEDAITISCSGQTEELRVPILKPEAYELRGRYSARQREFYREQDAINAQNPTLLAIDSLPTPMFLDLERRYQEGLRTRGDERGAYARRVTPTNPLAGSLRDSLEVAESLADRAYRQYLIARSERTDVLKQEIVLAAFRLFKSDANFGMFVPSPTDRKSVLKKIARNENVLPASLSQIGIAIEKVNSIVLPFFARVREVVSDLPSQEELFSSPTQIDEKAVKILQEWSAIEPQVRQIDRLVGLIEVYNNDVGRTFEPIGTYLESVNRFLADSNKQLFFEGGSLRVKVSEEDQGRPITALSSGERQLVVILTHLAFNRQAKRANVLIIDEPELSLHLRWQELFVDAVMKASPDIQLILATHSPSIIGGRIDSCIDVVEAQHSDRVLG